VHDLQRRHRQVRTASLRQQHARIEQQHREADGLAVAIGRAQQHGGLVVTEVAIDPQARTDARKALQPVPDRFALFDAEQRLARPEHATAGVVPGHRAHPQSAGGLGEPGAELGEIHGRIVDEHAALRF